MPKLTITDDSERSLVRSGLINHAHRCREIIKLHNETKEALKENAIELTATKAEQKLNEALTMIAKYYGIHLRQFQILLFELRSYLKRRKFAHGRG